MIQYRLELYEESDLRKNLEKIQSKKWICSTVIRKENKEIEQADEAGIDAL
jgi:UDP-N-acetylmuramate-alanine ligase